MTVPTVQTIDWAAVGSRMLGYRLMRGLTQQQMANECGIKFSTIARLEVAERKYSNLNYFWTFIRLQRVSINWLFNGIGEYHSDDPPELLPETIIQSKGKGIRRSTEQKNSDEGTFESDSLEFVIAVDAFRRLNNKPFTKATEMFEIIKALGYRKTAAPLIHPKGH